MRSISSIDFLRKFRQFWFSGSSSLPLWTSAKVAEQALNESSAFGLACMGKMRCFSMDKKLAHRGRIGKQVTPHPSGRKRAFRMMPGVMGGPNKVGDFPATEATAAPPRSVGIKAAIGGIRMNMVAAPPRRETNEVTLWKRRTQACRSTDVNRWHQYAGVETVY